MLRDTVNRTIWLAIFNDSFFQTMTPKMILPQKVSRFLKAATDEGQPSVYFVEKLGILRPPFFWRKPLCQG
jgi:hypothetical protein